MNKCKRLARVRFMKNSKLDNITEFFLNKPFQLNPQLVRRQSWKYRGGRKLL